MARYSRAASPKLRRRLLCFDSFRRFAALFILLVNGISLISLSIDIQTLVVSRQIYNTSRVAVGSLPRQFPHLHAYHAYSIPINILRHPLNILLPGDIAEIASYRFWLLYAAKDALTIFSTRLDCYASDFAHSLLLFPPHTNAFTTIPTPCLHYCRAARLRYGIDFRQLQPKPLDIQGRRQKLLVYRDFSALRGFTGILFFSSAFIFSLLALYVEHILFSKLHAASRHAVSNFSFTSLRISPGFAFITRYSGFVEFYDALHFRGWWFFCFSRF